MQWTTGVNWPDISLEELGSGLRSHVKQRARYKVELRMLERAEGPSMWNNHTPGPCCPSTPVSSRLKGKESAFILSPNQPALFYGKWTWLKFTYKSSLYWYPGGLWSHSLLPRTHPTAQPVSHTGSSPDSFFLTNTDLQFQFMWLRIHKMKTHANGAFSYSQCQLFSPWTSYSKRGKKKGMAKNRNSHLHTNFLKGWVKMNDLAGISRNLNNVA